MGKLIRLPSVLGVDLCDRLAIKTSSAEREAQVTAVLASATEPLGPTEIGRRVNKMWSVDFSSIGRSSPVLAVLRRIGAVRHPGGKYTMAKPLEF